MAEKQDKIPKISVAKTIQFFLRVEVLKLMHVNN